MEKKKINVPEEEAEKIVSMDELETIAGGVGFNEIIEQKIEQARQAGDQPGPGPGHRK